MPTTTEPIIELGWLQVLLLMGMVAIVLGMSLALNLGLVREFSIATARSIVQLVAVGLIIGWVFSARTWYWVVGLLLVMTLVAGFTGARRTGVKVPRLGRLMSVVLAIVTALTLAYSTIVVLGVRQWDPRYLIPLGGMMLGNAMTAAALAVERLTADLKQQAADVEVLLALGASPKEAANKITRSAVRAALIPTINTMMVVGIVQLPGMMTGQILGGSDPLQAAMYQFLILIAIAFCAALSATAMVRLLQGRFFTRAWQLDRALLGRLRVP